MRKITITDEKIEIKGFDNVAFKEPGESALDLGSCRDVARVATVWAIRKLVEDLELDLIGNWNCQYSGIKD